MDQLRPTDLPATPGAPHGRRLWIVGLMVIAAVLVGGAFGLVTLLTGDSDGPDPISRSKLLAEYTDLVPSEKPFATETNMGELVQKTCGLLDDSVPPSEMITSYAGIYGDKAQQVLRLLVSHGCPEHLAAFK